MEFNRAPSTLMHIDLNSCFATVEQQANPNLRGRPIAVAAYNSPRGCILAPSVEAKKFGVKTGMRIKDGRLLCSNLIILTPDSDKYRFIHTCLRSLISRYSQEFVAKSIDEFVINFQNYPGFHCGLLNTGREIKQRIKSEIGDWLTVSIGIGPNRFLAKLASNLKKPDGLEEINYKNYLEVYSRLQLVDLNGINTRLSARLSAGNIYNPLQFLQADIPHLRSIFHSINSYYWYLRLRGYEIDDINFGRKSFGNTYSLPVHHSSSENLAPILHKLVEKTSFRLRRSGYQTRGIYLGIIYTDHSFWHQRQVFPQYLFSAQDLYRHFYRLLVKSPQKPVHNLAITCFDLLPSTHLQLDLFGHSQKQLKLSKAMDDINIRYGNFVISSAGMINTESHVPDLIGFGNVGD